MSTNTQDKDDVPVTMALLSFFNVMDKSRSVFISEYLMMKELSMPSSGNWIDRCRDLFYKDHRETCKKMGLALNEVTFGAILDVGRKTPHEIIEEMNATENTDLPKRFVFNPWAGAVRRIDTTFPF